MSYLSSLNASTLLAQSSLAKGTERAAVSMERLSTGLAVASAKDDPSAYYAGSTLGARIAWEAQATKNISDANSLLNATDGAIEQVKTMLQRIRVLAMQAANATAELDRNLLQAEVDQLTSEIDRLTQTTVYNGQRLLNGEQDYRQFYVGGDARDKVSHRFSWISASRNWCVLLSQSGRGCIWPRGEHQRCDAHGGRQRNQIGG